MATHNDVTGDRIASKANSKAYRDGMDRIFGKKSRECDAIDTKSADNAVKHAKASKK